MRIQNLILPLAVAIWIACVVGCGSFDEHVKDAAQLQEQNRALKSQVEELMREIPDAHASVARAYQFAARAQEALEWVRQSDPKLSMVLAQPADDMESLLEELGDARERFPQIEQRLQAINARAGLAMRLSSRVHTQAVDLRNRASVMRNLAGLVGLRLPSGGASGGASVSMESNPLGYILGTAGTLGGVTAAGYGVYRWRRDRNQQRMEEERANATTNTVTVSIPPPQFAGPQQVMAGVARSGIPPPGAGAGQVNFNAGATMSTQPVQTPLASRPPQQPTTQPVATSNTYNPQTQQVMPRQLVAAAGTPSNVTMPPQG